MRWNWCCACFSLFFSMNCGANCRDFVFACFVTSKRKSVKIALTEEDQNFFDSNSRALLSQQQQQQQRLILAAIMQQKMMAGGRDSESPPGNGGGLGWQQANNRRVAYFNNNKYSNQYEKRGNKTLGWYLNDGLFDKSLSSEASSPSPPALHHQSSGDSGLGGGAPVSKTRATAAALAKMAITPPSPTPNENTMPGGAATHFEEKRKRKGRQRHRKVLDYSSALVGNPAHADDSIDETRVQSSLPKKDDYWYYDPQSDGYYYEVNGSRGWRKRDANQVAKDESQRMRQRMESDLRTAMISGYSSASLRLPGNEHVVSSSNGTTYFTSTPSCHHLSTKPQLFVPATHYYDPASDGYFYEMASVDGWKKRQPTAAAQQPPAATTRTTPPATAPMKISGRSRLHQGHYGPVPGASVPSSATTNLDDSIGTTSSGGGELSSSINSTPPPPRLNSNKPEPLWHHHINEALLDLHNGEQPSTPAEEIYHLPSNLFSARYSTDGWRSQPETPAKPPATGAAHHSGAESAFAFVNISPQSRENKHNNDKTTSFKTPTSAAKHPRPGSLILPPVAVPGDNAVEGRQRTSSTVLLDHHFNADRFLQDLNFPGSAADPEKVLRDLAALKTPMSATIDERRGGLFSTPTTPATLTATCGQWRQQVPAPTATSDWTNALDSPATSARDFLDSLLARDAVVEAAVWPSAIGIYAAPTIAGRKLID